MRLVLLPNQLRTAERFTGKRELDAAREVWGPCLDIYIAGLKFGKAPRHLGRT